MAEYVKSEDFKGRAPKDSAAASGSNGCEGNFGETMRYLEETQNKRGVTTATAAKVNPEPWDTTDHAGEPKPGESKIGT